MPPLLPLPMLQQLPTLPAAAVCPAAPGLLAAELIEPSELGSALGDVQAAVADNPAAVAVDAL
eukprot:5823299-Prymnesium_polylepis.1